MRLERPPLNCDGDRGNATSASGYAASFLCCAAWVMKKRAASIASPTSLNLQVLTSFFGTLEHSQLFSQYGLLRALTRQLLTTTSENLGHLHRTPCIFPTARGFCGPHGSLYSTDASPHNFCYQAMAQVCAVYSLLLHIPKTSGSGSRRSGNLGSAESTSTGRHGPGLFLNAQGVLSSDGPAAHP